MVEETKGNNEGKNEKSTSHRGWEKRTYLLRDLGLHDVQVTGQRQKHLAELGVGNDLPQRLSLLLVGNRGRAVFQVDHQPLRTREVL